MKKSGQSPLEYLNVLVDEWWVCNLRRKIYPLMQDKQRYNKICYLKKQRILEICERNQLESIFDDKEAMKALNKKFTGKGGPPQFPSIIAKDIEYYYAKGVDVRCFYGFTPDRKPIVKLGQVHEYDEKAKTVTVIFEKDGLEMLKLEQVTRIF